MKKNFKNINTIHVSIVKLGYSWPFIMIAVYIHQKMHSLWPCGNASYSRIDGHYSTPVYTSIRHSTHSPCCFYPETRGQVQRIISINWAIDWAISSGRVTGLQYYCNLSVIVDIVRHSRAIHLEKSSPSICFPSIHQQHHIAASRRTISRFSMNRSQYFHFLSYVRVPLHAARRSISISIPRYDVR